MSLLFHRLALLACLAATIGACGPLGGPDSAGPTLDPRWGSLISARTHGTVSKRERIRIEFTRDVAGEYLVGRPTSGVLVLDPQVEGAATFVSARELVFAPTADLPSGQEFRVRLSREGLLGLPDDLADYWFTFDVIAQDIELVVDGLDTESGDGEDLTLAGTMVTADYADPEAVEGVLLARQNRAVLEVRWEHDDDGMNHRFAVRGVTRAARDGVVQLRWSGQSIGASSRGGQDVPIPARDAFRITSVRAESDDRQYALVRFSDPLDRNQNLNGLVSLGNERFTVEVQGNMLRVIPGERVIGPATVVVEAGVRSAGGKRLEERSETEVTFTDVKPGVRFAGRGVVLPKADRLTVPIEAANVHSVQVTAFRVYDTNIGQFLQANDLSGGRELQRTGRPLWRRTIELPDEPGSGWARYNLDVSDLVRARAGSLVRLSLSLNRGNSTFACRQEQDRIPVLAEPLPPDLEDPNYAGSWNDVGEEYQGSLEWIDRNDPCTDSYFRWSSRTRDARNFLASNIGMTAKRDARGGILVATTDLRTSEPMSGVSVEFMNYQNQPLGTVVTGTGGMAGTTLEEAPHYAVADDGTDKGYLKMNLGTALPTSHFDVGGALVSEGLKGTIYGERGVWRPGDDIHLTFVLDDRGNPLPDGHPATLRLLNPMGQVVHTVTNSDPTGDFYVFTLGTDGDAPTGNWNAAVEVGGARFTAPVRIETVMPNRLKVELDLGEDELLRGGARHEATLFGQWLSGATARNLDTRCAGDVPASAHRLQPVLGLRLRRSGPRIRRRAGDGLRRRAGRRGFHGLQHGTGTRRPLPRDAIGEIHDADLRAGRRLQHQSPQPALLALRPVRWSPRPGRRRTARHAPDRYDAYRPDRDAFARRRAGVGGFGGPHPLQDRLALVVGPLRRVAGTLHRVRIHPGRGAGAGRHGGRAGSLGLPRQLPGLGPLPPARVRRRRGPLHRPDPLHRLARAGPAGPRNSPAPARARSPCSRTRRATGSETWPRSSCPRRTRGGRS